MDGNLIGTGQLCVISLFSYLQLYQERPDEGWSFQRKGRRESKQMAMGGGNLSQPGSSRSGMQGAQP